MSAAKYPTQNHFQITMPEVVIIMINKKIKEVNKQ